MKEKDINNRISLLVKELGYNKNSFSNKIGMSNNTTIGNLINKSFKPSYDVIYKIAITFPQINLDWLITGRGEMIPDKSVITTNIQKRVIKTIRELNGRMSLIEIAEMLNMKKDSLIAAYDNEVPSIELIVKLIQNKVVSSGEILFGRALDETQNGYCQKCQDKERDIMRLQRELIECLQKKD